jgi:hypothetical protein
LARTPDSGRLDRVQMMRVALVIESVREARRRLSVASMTSVDLMMTVTSFRRRHERQPFDRDDSPYRRADRFQRAQGMRGCLCACRRGAAAQRDQVPAPLARQIDHVFGLADFA